MCRGVRRGMRSRIAEGTSLSARMTVAMRMARWVARVRSAGEPGPEPARIMRGVAWVRRSRVEMSRGAGVGRLAGEGWEEME